jgi:predicted nucleic acid-binding protein
MTRPQIFENLSRVTVFEQVEYFIERFDMADDTSMVTDKLIQLLADYKIGGKQVHDANIVATMLANDIPAILTHNTKDFERFAELVTIEGV